jgi:integrase
MNAQTGSAFTSVENIDINRLTVLQRFHAEDIQTLSRDDLLAAQMLAGHGDTWGLWLSAGANGPREKYLAKIDLAGRLRTFLSKDGTKGCADTLLDEGVMVLTRLSIIMCIAPRVAFKPSVDRLKPGTIANKLYNYLPRLVARGIARRIAAPEATGFFSCLTDSDQREFAANKMLRIELDRLNKLVVRGLWSDGPPLPDIRLTSDPSQIAHVPAEAIGTPHLPLPDAWLSTIGPRVLWVVQELGPHLLNLLEALPEKMKCVDWSLTSAGIGRNIWPLIADHIAANPWRDYAGRLLKPEFPLLTCRGKHGADAKEWPPRTMEQVNSLSTTLQAAHLFIALLATAGRIGELAKLTRTCVEIARDGNSYLGGHTYKLSRNLFGDSRQWPAPPILCQVIGQQARLAAAFDWMPSSLSNGLIAEPRFADDFWVSIGNSGRSGESADMAFNRALHMLAIRLGMPPRPGGRSVHPHRFRKTVGRLAGVALFNSPLVLKRLFGHKSIEMTMHYILCDASVREEAEAILRELRIMHCAEALEEIRHAITHDLPVPGIGCAGAERLAAAVRNTAAELEQGGRTWQEGSAYDLACLLTMQGRGWRLIKENVVCSKAPGEDGMCLKARSKGEPNTANCQPECDNRIVFARKRRDVELSIEQYLNIAREARDDGQLLVLASVMDNLQDEWADFADLAQRYRADPEIQALLALCEEPRTAEEVA